MRTSRRRFLKLAGMGALASVAGPRLFPLLEPRALAQGVSFPAPPELGERLGSTVSFELAAIESQVDVAGRPATLWTYNGAFPGPTLRLREGDSVRLRLNNRLPEVTNLHFHGLHIPPTGNADNVFRRIAPGDAGVYEFTIPPGSAGTYWYHPHHHGTVASQLFRGLAGAIVVEGPLDEVFTDLPEQLLVLKDIEFNASGVVPPHNMMDVAMGREGSLLTVNGAELPELPVPGGAVRLRLLNASNARYYRLRLPGSQLTVIASDAGYVARPFLVEELLLAPGERFDVVASFPRAGSFELVTMPYNRAPEEQMNMGGMGGGVSGTAAMPGHDMGAMSEHQGMGGSTEDNGKGNSAMGIQGMAMGTGVQVATPLLRLAVQRAGDFQVPSRLADIDPLDPAEAVRRRRIVLSEDMANVEFFIDGRKFDPQRVDFAPALDTVEHWELVNETGMDHPMHLHVHPFQVLSPDGTVQTSWKDVVNVPARGTSEILVRFQNHPGKTVLHCHIVEHEDFGMMSVVEVG